MIDRRQSHKDGEATDLTRHLPTHWTDWEFLEDTSSSSQTQLCPFLFAEASFTHGVCTADPDGAG